MLPKLIAPIALFDIKNTGNAYKPSTASSLNFLEEFKEFRINIFFSKIFVNIF